MSDVDYFDRHFWAQTEADSGPGWDQRYIAALKKHGLALELQANAKPDPRYGADSLPMFAPWPYDDPSAWPRDTVIVFRENPMTETQITQADRDAYAAALEKMKYARSADAVRNGFEDKHPIVQAFAAHRLTNRTDATPVAWMYHHDGDLEHGWQRLKFERRLQTYEGMTCSEEDAGVIETPLFSHPPATDVAALVEAAENALGPMAELLINNCPAWHELSAALAPFTKGQNDENA